MINDKKVVVVMPAYNAGTTLEKTYHEIPRPMVDHVILVDDKSKDDTVDVAQSLGIETVLAHNKNKGYGGNQKSCYNSALELGADIVIMLHPDYQYSPKLIPAMAHMISSGHFEVVLGSRILGKFALIGGMPIYKYIANRFLTLVQNLLVSQKLSEYHTGYRAFTKDVLLSIDYEHNSDDFVFDNEMLSQIIFKNLPIGEITCPAKYEKESSSISFRRSVKYGLGVLRVSIQHFLHKYTFIKNSRYLQ